MHKKGWAAKGTLALPIVMGGKSINMTANVMINSESSIHEQISIKTGSYGYIRVSLMGCLVVNYYERWHVFRYIS